MHGRNLNYDSATSLIVVNETENCNVRFAAETVWGPLLGSNSAPTDGVDVFTGDGRNETADGTTHCLARAATTH